MGLQFFHNYLLWGSGLFLLPILIHLLRRRRIKIVRLPTYEFLLRTQRRIATRSQLKNWILLALRISAVLLVVFLAARPLLSGRGWAGGGSWSPHHLSVVIDNSASMAYRAGEGTRFDLAKRAARRLIENLSPRDRVMMLTTTGPRATRPGAAKPAGGLSKDAALARLSSVEQTDAAGDGVRALKMAMAGAEGQLDRRTIVVLSDMAKSDWEGLRIRGLRRVDSHTWVQFVRMAPEAGTSDILIQDVRLRPWPPRRDATFAVVFWVANRGLKDGKSISVSLFVGESRAGFSEMELKAGEEKEVSFRVLAPKEGSLKGRIVLSPDPLSATNSYYFSAEMGRRNRVLIIDGDPRRGLVDSESFYISNALRASPPGGDSPILVEVVAGYEMGRTEWSGYDLVVACNVGKWFGGAAESLRRYVEQGGGFLIAGGKLAGARMPGEGWLPAAFGQPRSVKPPQGAVVTTKGIAHPIFSLMGINPSRLFSMIRLRRVAPLSPAGGGQVLMALKDGTPVLVAGRAGAGKITVWGATCDRDWTDIPVRPVFVPFLRGIVNYLGARSEGAVAGIEAGEPIRVLSSAHRVGQSVQVKGPFGIEGTARLRGVSLSRPDFYDPGGSQGGRVEAKFTNTHRAGFYEILGPDEKEWVAANVPASEASLDALSEAELRERLPWLDLAVRAVGAEDSEPGSAIEGRLDLGIYLFLFMAAILVCEGALADRS